MFVTMFTSFGNLSRHSGRPRKLLTVISLLIFSYDPRILTRGIASVIIVIIIGIPLCWCSLLLTREHQHSGIPIFAYIQNGTYYFTWSNMKSWLVQCKYNEVLANYGPTPMWLIVIKIMCLYDVLNTLSNISKLHLVTGISQCIKSILDLVDSYA